MSKTPGEVKYLATNPPIKLTRGEDLLWYDDYGTCFALAEPAESDDEVVRCGIGLFSFDPSFAGTRACAPHDYAYSSPAYQKFKSRKEADLKMYNDLRKNGVHPKLATVMWGVARVLGGFFWEGSKR